MKEKALVLRGICSGDLS